jgi:acyl carrier protein
VPWLCDNSGVDSSSRPPNAIAETVRGVVARSLPLRWAGQPLPDSLPLGPEGAGLDSVAIVELLLACEESLGLPFSADLLDRGPLTVGRLVAHATNWPKGAPPE